jgi:transposase
LIEGGAKRSLSVAQAENMLASVAADTPVVRARIVAVGEFVNEVRALDAARKDARVRTAAAVKASATTVTDIYGIGPLMAAIIIGHAGDIRRFPTAGHFARHNGTAPIEASSGPKKRHRLNPRGDRQLNHAIHMAAVTQVRNETPGASTTSASKPRARGAKKRCVPSSAASATRSTANSSPTRAADKRGPRAHRSSLIGGLGRTT